MSKQQVDDLTAQLAARKRERPKLYAEASSEIKAAAIAADVALKRNTLMKSAKRPRVDLGDLEAVEARTDEFLAACENAAVVPTFLGLCTALGFTRQGLYAFLKRSPESPVAKFIELTRETLADALITSSLSRTTDAVTTIFVLKNMHNFVDRLEIEPVTPDDPLGAEPDQAALEARIEGLVVDD